MVAKKISSGKSWIDTLLDGGYDRGKLYLVGGVGVNWLEYFLRQSAVDICMDGSKGLLFSLEISTEIFCHRMARIKGKICLSVLILRKEHWGENS